MTAKRIDELEESMTLAITSKAKAMKAKGEKVIIMASGEPDFDTPSNIKNAAIKAINDGFTKYTATSGIDELKDLICEKFKKENNIDYKKSEVIVTVGGKQALFNLFQAVLNPGDEVIIPAPYWVSYIEQVKLAGAKSILLHSKDLGFDIEQMKKIVTPKTKMIILNSPNNPTGSIIEKETLLSIAELAVKNNLYIVSDEVYEKFIYDGKKHYSIASLNEEIKEITLIVNAFSKTYSMTGWRVGYCAGNQKIIKAMGLVQDHQTSNTCSISQKAAVEALKGSQDSVDKMVEEFNKRRLYMVDRLNAIKGIKCATPPGAFYTFPDISALYNDKIKGSLDFCQQLLEEMKVAVIPGIGFGYDNYIRLTYSASLEDIKEGMDRIQQFAERI